MKAGLLRYNIVYVVAKKHLTGGMEGMGKDDLKGSSLYPTFGRLVWHFRNPSFRGLTLIMPAIPLCQQVCFHTLVPYLVL